MKGLSEDGFWFNGKVNVIDTNLEVLIKVPTQETKIKLYKNQIDMANLKSFSKPFLSFLFIYFFLYIKNIFILGVPLQSNLIRHWDVQSAFKDSQRILQHLRHSDRDWVFWENSESTRKFKARGKHLPSRVLGALYWQTRIGFISKFWSLLILVSNEKNNGGQQILATVSMIHPWFGRRQTICL